MNKKITARPKELSPEQLPESAVYTISCFTCYRPMTKVGGIAHYRSKRCHPDGRYIELRYQICEKCADAMRSDWQKTSNPMERMVNYKGIQLYMQFEPLAAFIAEQEDKR